MNLISALICGLIGQVGKLYLSLDVFWIKKGYKVVTLGYPYMEISMRCDMTVALST